MCAMNFFFFKNAFFNAFFEKKNLKQKNLSLSKQNLRILQKIIFLILFL
jgi:hypothetical protein